MGLLSFLFSSFLRFILVLIFTLIALPFLPDSLFTDFPFHPITSEPPLPSKQWNNLISEKSEILLRDQILGPESFAFKNDNIYTGLMDGRLVKINRNTLQIVTLTNFARPNSKICSDNVIKNEVECGRPLGLKFGPDGALYAIEASQGLYKINPNTGSKQLIALNENDKSIPKKFFGIFNDFVFDPVNSNLVYVTLSIKSRQIDQILWGLIENIPEGSLLAVDLTTKKVKSILDNLNFPNGIEVSSDKKNLLVSITNEYKIIQISLPEAREAFNTGGFVKKTTPFISNLPGVPDNIKLFGNDYYLALPLAETSSSIITKIKSKSMIRKAVNRASILVLRSIKWLKNYYPSIDEMFNLTVKLTNGHILFDLMPFHHSAVLVIDSKTGKIKHLLGSSKIAFISEGFLDQSNGDLYIGSFKNNYIARIKARDLNM